MNGFTKYITERPWEDIVTTWFVLVDDAIQRAWTSISRQRASTRLFG